MVDSTDVFEDGAMISTQQTPPLGSETRHPISGLRWAAAFGEAICTQIVAAVAALAAVAIFLIAAFDDWANQDSVGLPAYVMLSIPLVVAAPALFVASGAVAARISGDRRGWSMLLVGPMCWLLLRALSEAF